MKKNELFIYILALTTGESETVITTAGDSENVNSDEDGGLATKWIILIAVAGFLVLAVLFIAIVAFAVAARKTSKKRKERRLRELDNF